MAKKDNAKTNGEFDKGYKGTETEKGDWQGAKEKPRANVYSDFDGEKIKVDENKENMEGVLKGVAEFKGDMGVVTAEYEVPVASKMSKD